MTPSDEQVCSRRIASVAQSKQYPVATITRTNS